MSYKAVFEHSESGPSVAGNASGIVTKISEGPSETISSISVKARSRQHTNPYKVSVLPMQSVKLPAIVKLPQSTNMPELAQSGPNGTRKLSERVEKVAIHQNACEEGEYVG